MFKINSQHKTLLADTTTPVSIYLRLRDVYPNCILLESSDYHSRENSTSYICAAPFSGIMLRDGKLTENFPDGSTRETQSIDITSEIEAFKSSFDTTGQETHKLINAGLFGYFTWSAIPSFEKISFRKRPNEKSIPEMNYQMYRYIIAVDHFRNEITLFENVFGTPEIENLNKLGDLIQQKTFSKFNFSAQGGESSDLTDGEFISLVETMKTHIKRGDVFQIVPSRAYQQNFNGDEFNVYRCLRSINPSPYLFYFDYGDFRLFGSSPEAQITIKNGEANIFPIAGTFKRTGNDEEDALAAKRLEDDPKESAEHVMLVDLARNDLSRNCEKVSIRSFKDIQYYSHLIHLVSRVSGKLKGDSTVFNVVADTYPAGTLSGAPKYKAMELIDKYESTGRNFYAGAIGYMGFNQEFNHAIMIRTFLSEGNRLHYRAGAGIVSQSDPSSELQEVNNKIAALRKAIEMATNL